MGNNYTSVATLFVALILLVNFSIAESEINGTGLDKKSEKVVENEKSSVDAVKNVEDGKIGGKSGVEKSKLITDEKKGEEFAKNEGGGDLKNGKGDMKLPAVPVRKESSRGEECDSSSISCTDDKKTLVACLRVPGDDPGESPEFSLLIQNKEKRALTIKISAPDFVRLEKNQIQIQEKEDKKVRVYIKGGGNGNFIVLNAGNGNCSLDFKDLIVHSSSTGMQVNNASQFTYINFVKRTPILALVCLSAALLLIVTPWMCIKFRKRKLGESGVKYERLDMELPVTASGKTEESVVVNDEWDDSWGDSWDDEEAPKTPSMPVIPSLSSRRLNKDGWKD